MAPANEYFPELYTSTLKSSLEWLNLGLGVVARLQEYQAEAVDEMRSEQTRITAQVGSLRSLDELRPLQAQMLRDQMARMTAYWSGFYATACQSQMELLKEAQERAEANTASIVRKLDATPAAAEPVAAAFKLAVGAAQSTYAATMRATEEIMRLSAAQAGLAKSKAAPAARPEKVRRAA